MSYRKYEYNWTGWARSALQYREDKDWSLAIPCVNYKCLTDTLFYFLHSSVSWLRYVFLRGKS